jgi:protein-S-isoprenylcysteine O-methyltransferase Ste14
MVALVVLARYNPTPSPWPEPARWLGVPLIVGGLVLAVWARRLFTQAETTLYTFDEPARLVTAGPFGFTRNPMYLGFVGLLLGSGLLAHDFVGVVLAFAFFLISDRWYIPFEERMAAARLGQPYQDYRARVRRWV